MSKRQIPTHPDGWKFAGACGAYIVWHAGKNDYRVERDGVVLARADQLSPAHTKAQQLYSVDRYYSDRNASGQAALTAHR